MLLYRPLHDQYEAVAQHLALPPLDLVLVDNVGDWISEEKVTTVAIASYVGAVLIYEGYAERVAGESSKIRCS